MSVLFMTEFEAEALIEKNMDKLVSRVVCGTQCTNSGASASQNLCDVGLQCDPEAPDDPTQCCGCCDAFPL